MTGCQKECQAGQFLTATCTCATCPDGQFTATVNSFTKCRKCEHCYEEKSQQTKRNCSSTQDTQCACIRGHYCNDMVKDVGSCTFCPKRRVCKPGTGAVNITDTEDTKCTDCPHGYFSNVTDSYSPCLRHTDCGERELIKKGTSVLDTVCGKEPCLFNHHHWILPAGLWAGLIIAVIIILAYVYWKMKSKSRRTVSLTDDAAIRLSPVRAPDILPPPMGLYKSECTETHPFFCAAVETSSISCDCREVSVGAGHTAPLASACDCTLECDGPTSSIVTSPTSPMRLTPLAAVCGPAVDSTGCSVCHSEPQEDEWNGA